MVGDGETIPVPFWVWRLEDAFLFGHPNEAYSFLQVELRRRFSRQALAVLNVVNGWTGYLAPRDLYGKNLYPVWQSPFDAGSLERLIGCATGVMERLANS